MADQTTPPTRMPRCGQPHPGSLATTTAARGALAFNGGMSPNESAQELDRRTDGTLHVTLLWYRQANRFVVEVYDDGAGQMFELDVAPECAHDAFRNPYAYAPLEIVLRAVGRGAVPEYRRAAGRCARRDERPLAASGR